MDDDGYVAGLVPDLLVKPGPVTGKNGQTQLYTFGIAGAGKSGDHELIRVFFPPKKAL